MAVNPFAVFDDSSGKTAARDAYTATTGGINKGLKAAERYGGRATDALYSGQDKAIGALDAGKKGANKYYIKGMQPQKQLFDRGKQGVDYYGQLVGLGGGDPAQMQTTLEGIPGYQFARDQGIEALNRSANARGMLTSGNNTQDILKYSQGLADQNYFNYLNALDPYFGLAQNSAAGIQQGYGNMATNVANVGANKANVYTGTASNIANVNTGLGNTAYNANVGIGQAGADQAANMYNAEQAASGNLWNAILGLGGLATGGIGSYVGAGGTFS